MDCHVAIVGAYGSAGTAVAGELVDVDGVDLTLIDDGDPGGGLCILRGCMPSKEVLSAGAHRFQARDDHRLSGTPAVDLQAVVETKDRHITSFAEHRRAAVGDWAERDDVDLLRETARFVDERTLQVGDRRIDADYVVIATGSSPKVPEIPGIETVEYMTSADVLDATDFPDSGIVLGFGYVGLELVPYLSEAGGMELVVVEHDERPIDEADPVFGDVALDLYRDKFDCAIPTNVVERRLETTPDGGVRLTVDHETDGRSTYEADQLFVFTGREPSLEGLRLSAAGLSPADGWVRDTMQARDDDRVFVVGDANGKEPILHVAKEQGFTAAENILAHARGESLTEYENTHHHVIFSGLGVYPFARVGHNAETADATDRDVAVVTRQASDDGVFKTKDAAEGLARLVVDRDDGTVLGYQGLHYHADVMAKTMQVIVELGLDVREVPDRAYHPTTPEILDGLFRDAVKAIED